MAYKWALLLLALPALLAGCNRLASPTANTLQPTAASVPWELVDEVVYPPPPPPRPTPSPDIRMVMFFDGTVVKSGEKLRMLVRVFNGAGKDLDYYVRHTGESPFYTVITPECRCFELPRLQGVGESVGGGMVVLPPGGPRPRRETLEADDFVEWEYTWDLTVLTDAGPVLAPNGLYKVTASFGYGGRDGTDVSPRTSVTYEVEVVDSYDVITSFEAREIVSALPAYQRWKEAHNGYGVKRQDPANDRYWLNDKGTWVEVDLRRAERVGWNPTSSVSTLDPEGWTFTFGSTYGFPPNEIVVKVDWRTGEVVNVDPDLDRELKGGVLATFQTPRHTFRLFSTNPDTIDAMFKLKRGELSGVFPFGPLVAGPGPGMYNGPSSWHLDPEASILSDFSNEACDGSQGFVEDDLERWLKETRVFCPSNARLIEMADFR